MPRVPHTPTLPAAARPMNASQKTFAKAPLRTARGQMCAVLLVLATSLPGRAERPAFDPFLYADRVFEHDAAIEHVAYLTSDGSTSDFAAEAATYGTPGEAWIGGDYGSPYDAPQSVGWDLLPDGLIYRSYLAGPRESRLALHTFHNRSAALGDDALWEATLGGRGGLLRYGFNDPSNPSGWQLDIEGATIVRLNLDESRDVEASDFRFGVPLTWGSRQLAYKIAYYHISSHLGDERAERTGDTRINYVRDVVQFGTSWYPDPWLRVYGEVGYAFFTAGGAEPWEFQFGLEYACPGPTGFRGTPFVATNAHLREEVDFGGDWTLQAGWLWRGDTGRQMRVGLHYMNGLSTQYQFFDLNEEQIGLGIWYDF